MKKKDAKFQQRQREEINEILSKAKEKAVKNEALLKRLFTLDIFTSFLLVMDPFKGAQDVIRCDVCSDNQREKSPAEVRCNTCDTNVCSPCVARHMKCLVTICLNCFVSNHNNHTIEVLTELSQKLCEDIQNETKELQQRIIPAFEKMSCEGDENLKKLNEAYDKLESSIEERGKVLHRRVDAVVSKYKTNV
uniref:B box-type domain-containing protein n=1 Tax=Magallana gigas TaxID=29159 RepID=A0A8W8JUT5_MAGGI